MNIRSHDRSTSLGPGKKSFQCHHTFSPIQHGVWGYESYDQNMYCSPQSLFGTCTVSIFINSVGMKCSHTPPKPCPPTILINLWLERTLTYTYIEVWNHLNVCLSQSDHLWKEVLYVKVLELKPLVGTLHQQTHWNTMSSMYSYTCTCGMDNLTLCLMCTLYVPLSEGRGDRGTGVYKLVLLWISHSPGCPSWQMFAIRS